MFFFVLSVLVLLAMVWYTVRVHRMARKEGYELDDMWLRLTITTIVGGFIWAALMLAPPLQGWGFMMLLVQVVLTGLVAWYVLVRFDEAKQRQKHYKIHPNLHRLHDPR